MVMAGRISINGEKILTPGVFVSEKDLVCVDGEPIVNSAPGKVYIMINKPKGVITTASDEYGRTNVIDLVKSKERLFPIGRLDKDTTGVLILTNDGDLADRLTHPRYEKTKRYTALLDRVLSKDDLEAISSGVQLSEGTTAPCAITFPGTNHMMVNIELHEGKNRQIHRMFNSYEYMVRELERVEFAGLTAEGLKPGAWRHLTQAELKLLKGKT